jgi:hypothetical protein
MINRGSDSARSKKRADSISSFLFKKLYVTGMVFILLPKRIVRLVNGSRRRCIRNLDEEGEIRYNERLDFESV